MALTPALAISLSIAARAPDEIAIIVITEATPTMTPSAVSAERILFWARARIAMSTTARIRIASSAGALLPTWREGVGARARVGPRSRPSRHGAPQPRDHRVAFAKALHDLRVAPIRKAQLHGTRLW